MAVPGIGVETISEHQRQSLLPPAHPPAPVPDDTIGRLKDEL